MGDYLHYDDRHSYDYLHPDAPPVIVAAARPRGQRHPSEAYARRPMYYAPGETYLTPGGGGTRLHRSASTGSRQPPAPVVIDINNNQTEARGRQRKHYPRNSGDFEDWDDEESYYRNHSPVSSHSRNGSRGRYRDHSRNRGEMQRYRNSGEDLELRLLREKMERMELQKYQEEQEEKMKSELKQRLAKEKAELLSKIAKEREEEKERDLRMKQIEKDAIEKFRIESIAKEQKEKEARIKAEIEKKEAIEKYEREKKDKAEKEKAEKEARDREYKERMENELRKSGMPEQQVQMIVRGKEVKQVQQNVHEMKRVTYTKMARRHISLETLRVYNVPWKYDDVSYFLSLHGWSRSCVIRRRELRA
jgi:hypothetical protein